MVKMNSSILFLSLILLVKMPRVCVGQALYQAGPDFPLLNSYAPNFMGWASPGYVFSSYSMGGFKFQGVAPPEEEAEEGGGEGGGGGGGGGGRGREGGAEGGGGAEAGKAAAPPAPMEKGQNAAGGGPEGKAAAGAARPERTQKHQ